MVKNNPLICDCCGGKINRTTMKCEYCDTKYRLPEGARPIEIRCVRPGEQTLATSFSIDRHALKEDGPRLMEYVAHEMAFKLAEGLLPYCEFYSDYSPYNDRVRIMAECRVIEPVEPGDIQVRRLYDEGLY